MTTIPKIAKVVKIVKVVNLKNKLLNQNEKYQDFSESYQFTVVLLEWKNINMKNFMLGGWQGVVRVVSKTCFKGLLSTLQKHFLETVTQYYNNYLVMYQ